MEEPLGDDERETFRLEPEEAQNIRADLEDLGGMRRTFQDLARRAEVAGLVQRSICGT